MDNVGEKMLNKGVAAALKPWRVWNSKQELNGQNENNQAVLQSETFPRIFIFIDEVLSSEACSNTKHTHKGDGEWDQRLSMTISCRQEEEEREQTKTWKHEAALARL